MASQHDQQVVIDIYGEGKTDVGRLQDTSRPVAPTEGVIPIIVHRLCGEPQHMLVRLRGRPFLMQKGTLERKSTLARRISKDSGAKGVVFVVDSDGPASDRKYKHDQLVAGRKKVPDGPAMAVGVAQPCVEAWLLAGIDVSGSLVSGCSALGSVLRNRPEDLPHHTDDPWHPKRLLAWLDQLQQQDVSAERKWELARQSDLAAMAQKCPLSFRPFVSEVQSHIKPLF